MPHDTSNLTTWSPVWNPAFCGGWAAAFVRRNLWRCERVHDFDDLMQDAYLVFVKVAKAYPAVRQPAQFTALYQRALANYFHGLARHKRITDRVLLPDGTGVADMLPTYNDGYISVLISEVPEVLLQSCTGETNASRLAELKKWLFD